MTFAPVSRSLLAPQLEHVESVLRSTRTSCVMGGVTLPGSEENEEFLMRGAGEGATFGGSDDSVVICSSRYRLNV